MLLHELSSAGQDYLKALWTIRESLDRPVSTKMLAERLRVSASTVSETVSRLARQGLVVHEPYGAIELSASGRQLAIVMVRRHRLIETFLVQELGYTWDEVHDEAEVLEHAVSDRLVERIDSKLGFPTRDPHGDPIPSPTGTVPDIPARRLSELNEGESGTVLRISDDSPEMLRHFAFVGLTIHTSVTVVERRDFAGILLARVSGRSEDVHLGDAAARSVWVTA